MKRRVLAAVLVLGTLLVGCLPIPNLRADLKLPTAPQRLEPRRVKTQYVSLPGENTVGTPRRLNRTFYLRYYAPGAGRKNPDTVLILMPGIFGGAASFDPLVRQLVASRAGLEVWAVDRRANALEDPSALRQSLRTRNPETAYRYYGEDAGTPAGFNAVSADDAGFMRRWGLVTHLRDLHAVVKKANAKAETVVLGGHSLGASIVSFYAAYRFADGLGDAQLDGLLLLDGTLGRTGAFGLTAGLTLGNLELIPGATGYDAGRGPPFLALGVGPGFYAQQESRALLARFRPKQLAPDTSFPLTNLAYVGVRADEAYAPSATFGTSLGEAVGARYGGNVVAFLLDGPGSSSSRTVAGVAPGFDRVSWSPGDPEREHTAMSAYLRARVTLQSDFNEWYFPLRLLVDMSELPLELSSRTDFVPHSEVSAPTLAIGVGRGLVTSLDGFSAYSNLRASALFSSYVIPGFTHIDIVTARENPVVPLFGRWLAQITQLRRNQ